MSEIGTYELIRILVKRYPGQHDLEEATATHIFDSVLKFYVVVVNKHSGARLSSTYQINCSFGDANTKFGRRVDIYLGNKTGYWAIAHSQIEWLRQPFS